MVEADLEKNLPEIAYRFPRPPKSTAFGVVDALMGPPPAPPPAPPPGSPPAPPPGPRPPLGLLAPRWWSSTSSTSMSGTARTSPARPAWLPICLGWLLVSTRMTPCPSRGGGGRRWRVANRAVRRGSVCSRVLLPRARGFCVPAHRRKKPGLRCFSCREEGCRVVARPPGTPFSAQRSSKRAACDVSLSQSVVAKRAMRHGAEARRWL